jgi:hypothetical protein
MPDDPQRALPRARAWLPDPPHAARLAVTAALLWLMLRIAFAGVQQMVFPVPQPLALHPVAALAVVGVTAAAVALDERRRRETLFYANLGIPPVWAGIVGFGVAAVLESCAWLVLGSGG